MTLLFVVNLDDYFTSLVGCRVGFNGVDLSELSRKRVAVTNCVE